MFLRKFTCGPIATCGYFIGCEQSKTAVLIDAPQGITQHIQKLLHQTSFSLKKVILTHSHWDHTADVASLLEQFTLDVYVHANDYANLKHPGSDGLPLFFPLQGIETTFFLKEGDVIEEGSLEFDVMETPGHSPGSVCLWMKKENILFSGDTLFQGGMGNVSFPTSNPLFMKQSLQKLGKLPLDTVVYPGHGESTTIQAEAWIKSS
ncbi:MBL fold metallo-hydrolase [Rhabdochlamydiaceae symbiont of Dictyostelium giganteum]|uniref:MBL fold metallo-hydrolase n=1 Tax=Rhabdochlamydiaceae symbiont of Dictyostelium giganteum TaxID=3342349 RepID=UPI00384F0826